MTRRTSITQLATCLSQARSIQFPTSPVLFLTANLNFTRCYGSNEKAWSAIFLSPSYEWAYIRDNYTAFLSPFNYNVWESWNDIVLLFCTSLSPFNSVFLLPSRAAHRLVCAFKKKPLCTYKWMSRPHARDSLSSTHPFLVLSSTSLVMYNPAAYI